MKFSISVTNSKPTASFGIVSSLLAIAPLWLLLAAANTSVDAQTSDNAVPSSTSASSTPSPADWTQFMRDNTQRWNPYETALGVNNVGSLKLKWKKPIGTSSGPPWSSPAVVNGVVYFGSTDGSMYALSASTGATLWSYATGDSVYSSPAVANGVVYFGSHDHNVYALNASTGTKLWSYTTGGPIVSSPAVANGVVYIGSLFDKNDIYALNANTGTKLWSYTSGDDLVYSSPAVANGIVYVPTYGHLFALDANTGTKLWSFNTGLNVMSAPAVANGVVYVGSLFGNVYALNANTGAKLWSYTSNSSTINQAFCSPAVANGVVYICSNDGNLYALNAITGAKLWSFTGGSVSSPAVANGVVYISPSGAYALDASTGVKLWSYATGFEYSSPTIVDGVVYVRGPDDATGKTNLYAFSVGADLFLRIQPTPTTVHQGDLITYAFPAWNLGPNNAVHEVLNTQVPVGTVIEYLRISGTPGLGTCTAPPYQGTGQIVCHENSAMAPNTTWTVRVTVKVTAPAGTVITENAATLADTPDPNAANNMATVSTTVQ